MTQSVNVTLPKLKVVAAINKDIDAVISMAKDVQRLIGEAGLQSLMHLKAHGDVGPVNRLLVGLPKGVRRTALASWLLTHGALAVNTDAVSKKTKVLTYDKNKSTDPEAAMVDPWFDHLPEKAIDEVFDLQKAIHSLLAKAKGKPVKVGGKLLSADVATDMLKGIGALVGEEFVGAAVAIAPEATV